MPNVEPTSFSMRIERAAASLDTQVREYVTFFISHVPLAYPYCARSALGSLGLLDSPHMWSDQLDRVSFEIYRSAVRGTKVTIRAVSQEFRGMDRTRRLLDGARDTVTRIDVLRSMVDAVRFLIFCSVSRSLEAQVPSRWAFLRCLGSVQPTSALTDSIDFMVTFLPSATPLVLLYHTSCVGKTSSALAKIYSAF